ncbi:BTAD domain-containing putative transcriptional regulator [Actinorugispora endophytica]|uniref:Transcriptional regulator n=1 Tax=Actinorugispora endophytica TaxID=1605990 RepID=A0A4R6V6Y7_9ACTN|nr:BTAD domain-containing putative transcriptional regulator [Actinorugispora endophytica]TDQ54277.1 transcriptional regulator [Actinorugispora endophytica]
MAAEATGATAVAFRVLGPLEAADGRGPLPLKGPRHRAVLARLVAAEGRVVPVDRLVEDLWEAPSDGAVAAVRTFVSGLRRALEPDRPPRRPARLLVTAPPGYALRAAPAAVDARRFEAAVTRSGPLLASGRSGEALAGLEEALALWRGPAYAEFAAYPWARGEADRLDGLRLLAVERRAEALLDLGRAVDAVPALEAHAREHPLRENAGRQLALALYRSGRQGDALSALRRVREALVAELGVDPGPELRRLEADILAQAPRLTPRAPAPATALPDPPPRAEPTDEPVSRPFVGREQELELLERAAGAAARHGATRAALVSGDAGAGKTALAEALARRLAERGWTTAWGRGPEHDGAPGAWPWTQIADTLTAGAGLGAPRAPADAPPAADPAAARFRALREAASLLASAAARGPVLLVFDDLHRAGEETLELLTALAAGEAPGAVLLVGTYRTGEVSPALAGALARLAPREPARVYLGGLPEEATGELVRAVVHRGVDARTVRVIHRRSGGNPFFARELARLFHSEGGAALDAVPAGVRDVIRHRLAALPPSARRLLRQAAVIGHDVDPDVLAALADDEDDLLDSLDAALRAGFLTERDTRGPRFAHALVRDTLYDDVSGPRRARWHTAVAEALETLRPDDVDSLAHHFGRAATRATAARAAHYARAAAFRAERRFAPHEAARLWRDAVAAHDRSDGGDARGRLEAVMGMVRALAVTGRLEEARRHRAEAVAAAEGLGDPELTAEVVTAFDVPAVWTRGDDETLARQVAEAAERTLAALPGDRDEQRARLLGTVALETRGTSTDRGRRAAREAEAIARRLGDPALLALALNARFMQSFQRAGAAPRRVETGTELVELATRHDLVTFGVLGRLVLVQAHSALADFTAADTHAAAADRLGARYEIPLVGVFTQWYAALRLAAAGRGDEAEAAYRTASVRLADTGMPGVEEGILPLALLCLRLQNGEPALADARAAWGPYAPWVRPWTSPDAAPGEAEPIPDAPPGQLNEALTCLAARAAVAGGDRPAMERAYRRLLPAAGELAGAGSGLLTLGPVAHHLGDLARALGRRAEAADHYRQALRVATRAGAPHWTAAAREALGGQDR